MLTRLLMGMVYLMRILISLFLLFFGTLAHAQSIPPTFITDEGGARQGPIYTVNCVGSGVACSKSGTTGTVTVATQALTDLSDVNSTTVTAGRLLMADGTDFESVEVISGDVALSPSGQLTINASAVTENMLKAVDAAADEESLTYETTTGDFEWQSAGAASTLADLTDVNSTTATAGRMFVADGTDWESVAMSGSCTMGTGGVISCSGSATLLIDLTDVNSSTVTAGRLLMADGTDWESVGVISGDVALSSSGQLTINADKVTENMLKAVDAAGDEECLTSELTTGDFEWQTCGGGASSLVDLTDVASATVTAGRMLIADGTDWDSVAVTGDIAVTGAGAMTVTADTIALSDLSDVNSTTATAGRLLMADGTDFESVGIISGDVALSPSGQLTINADKVTEAMLKAVDVAADEESLTYETTTGDFEWQSAGAASTLADLTDVNTTTATRGNILIADGTDWESVTAYGDVTIQGSGETQIGSDKVRESMLKAVDTAADEEFLTFETTTGDFEWQAGGGGATTLADLTDVNTTTATGGRVLIADGTDWESMAVYGDVQMSAAGQALVVAETIVMNDLNDINTSTPTAGNLLLADGTDWESVSTISYTQSGGLVLTNNNKPSTFQRGVVPSKVTADPCSDTTAYPEGSIFWNDTSNYFCFCNASNADIKTVDDTTACF